MYLWRAIFERKEAQLFRESYIDGKFLKEGERVFLNKRCRPKVFRIVKASFSVCLF